MQQCMLYLYHQLLQPGLENRFCIENVQGVKVFKLSMELANHPMKLYNQEDQKYGKNVYIGEEIFGCAIGFLSEITQISKLLSNKISYMTINFI